MVTPYDWQEGIGHRAAYVESRLAGGTPVLMLSVKEGVLALTVRRQARKIYEVYDRLMMGAIGQQSDVEAVRIAAIDFAHQEGYQRSESDVTIQRLVTALSQPMKRAFADFNLAPVIARTLFAEVGKAPEDDKFYVLDYDGDFSVRAGGAYIVGSEEAAGVVRNRLPDLASSGLSQQNAIKELKLLWAAAASPGEDLTFEKLTEDLEPEVALLSRSTDSESRFRLI